MTDFASTPPARGPELPPAVPFDPAADALPPPLTHRGGRGDTVVLLLDAARDREWAADTAVALASAWAKAGRRVVLADLHLEDPLLHDRLGEPNLDGVVDVFLYGASLARTARPVPGRGFYLLSAGTYTADAEAVLRHPRWAKIVAGFRDAEASLLLFAPPEAADLSALAGSTVVLGEGDGRLPAGAEVRAVLAPPAVEVEVPEVEAVEMEEPVEERPDPLLGEYARGIPASTLPPGAKRPAREPDLSEPPPPEPARRRRGAAPERKVSPLLLGALVLTLLLAGGYFLLEARPELLAGLRGGNGEGAAVPAAVEPAPAPPPAYTGVALPYAVQAKAFASLPSARQFVEAEGERFPGVPFYVSPVLIDQVVYYKVLAGVLPDTAAAARLRERLVQAEVVDEADAQGAWNLIQPTPYAFDLGELPTRPAAEARADSLLAREIPSYPVALPYSDGSERWRLYGGAFADSASAEVMRRLLVEKGVEAPLVERTGKPTRVEG